jgi:quercetin dioxygenase-like cupin family protein
MEVKQNDATYNRPAGERILDAPWIFTDLEVVREQLRSENAWEKNDRNGLTVFKTDQMTSVVTILKEGAEICENSVDGLLVIQLISGKVVVETGGSPFELNPGQLLHLHEGVEHSISAKEETLLLLTTCLRGS